ncbi:MAG: bifunctional precorrin-2 dehydrogenase/sirohydrochlorin ferrochelatase [Acidimicrobiales bacterium]|nr:bifunctional precorrin-2 dehydrogenase/sirohydrochlorin ferrochelatase [Acidimicrobiales bacterium]HRW38668.1 bifunctional precorrin-2 dehydrogenase/sirohydrochlorin ferrochelatase [Aquihabitans sp.]
MAVRYPVMVDLEGQPVLVVGGGEVATRKVLGLLAAGAEVHVVAPELAAPLAELAGVGTIRWHATAYLALGRPRDHRPWWFVVAATDDATVNDRVVADAARAGVWANHAGRADGGAASVPASRSAGRATVAVATGGAHPAAARWLCDRAVDALDPAALEVLDLVEEVRAHDGRHGRPGRRPDWQCAVDSGTLDLIREGRRAEAKERLQACLSSSSD